MTTVRETGAVWPQPYNTRTVTDTRRYRRPSTASPEPWRQAVPVEAWTRDFWLILSRSKFLLFEATGLWCFLQSHRILAQLVACLPTWL